MSQEVCLGVLDLLPHGGEPARCLQCAHPHRQLLRVSPCEVVQVPLEVGSEPDVHAWQENLMDVPAVVLPRGGEAVEDVVLVGGHNEVPN